MNVGPPALSSRLDGVSQAWVDGLYASGASHDRCVAQLLALLLRVARHEARRKAASIRLKGPELDDVVNQVADEALMAIKAKVGEFRGESRFTTWAYRFVVYEVSTKIGRHCWRNRPTPLEAGAWERIPDSLTVSPQTASEQREEISALRDAIDHDLTDLQRRVFVAIALNDVPTDAFARGGSRPRTGGHPNLEASPPASGPAGVRSNWCAMRPGTTPSSQPEPISIGSTFFRSSNPTGASWSTSTPVSAASSHSMPTLSDQA